MWSVWNRLTEPWSFLSPAKSSIADKMSSFAFFLVENGLVRKSLISSPLSEPSSKTKRGNVGFIKMFGTRIGSKLKKQADSVPQQKKIPAFHSRAGFRSAWLPVRSFLRIAWQSLEQLIWIWWRFFQPRFNFENIFTSECELDAKRTTEAKYQLGLKNHQARM